MKRLLPVLMCFAFQLLSSTEGWSLPPCPAEGHLTSSPWSDCFGTYTDASGDKYVGAWKDGQSHGQGTYTSSYGSKYVGEWKDGWKHGQGTYTHADGRVEEGIWENGELKSAKKLSPPVTAKKSPTKRSSLPPCPGSPTDKYTTIGKWTDCFGTFGTRYGYKYVGEYKDGKRYGQGTYIHRNGDKYIGEWKEGKRHGQGTYSHRNGDKYVGEWKEGKRHGQGNFTYIDGTKYVGQWKDGQSHGQGNLTYSDGKVKEGIWENEKFLYAKKPSPTVTAKKSRTKGSSLPPCQGSPTNNLNNIRSWTDCFGSAAFAYGNYVGEWKNGNIYGQGILTFADGRVEEGIWENGALKSAKKLVPTIRNTRGVE